MEDGHSYLKGQEGMVREEEEEDKSGVLYREKVVREIVREGREGVTGGKAYKKGGREREE